MRYRYLIIPVGSTPFFTHWCSEELFPIDGGTAFDLENEQMSIDGVNWFDVDKDHL